MSKKALALAAALALLGSGASAKARDTLSQIMAQGDWHADLGRSIETGAPDECIATTLQGGFNFVFLSGADERLSEVEVVISHPTWAFTPGAAGNIDINIQGYIVSFRAYELDFPSPLVGKISSDTFRRLTDAMTRASSMTVTVGKAAPIALSLTGSTAVMRAFETCSGMNKFNPFK